MLSYNLDQEIRIEVWVHPDRQVENPLHPINRATECECEFEFISTLKNILKQLLPTINFGKGKTFIYIERHLRELKKALDEKTKKNLSYNQGRRNRAHTTASFEETPNFAYYPDSGMTIQCTKITKTESSPPVPYHQEY